MQNGSTEQQPEAIQDRRPACEPKECCEPSTSLPKCFLIVHSVAKKHNVGNLLRSCTAFGVAEVCLCGSREFTSYGSHGAGDYVAIRHFPSLPACCEHLKRVEGCKIVGVEIMDAAQPVQGHPFCGPTAFILGNEGRGLSESQIRVCDSFVYIPQYGSGTASLNVYVAASIVLHHFATWAGYREQSRTAGKFDLSERPVRLSAKGMAPLSEEALQAERERRHLRKQDAALSQDHLEGFTQEEE